MEVDYEELAPIATMEHALDSSRPAIWPAPDGNVLQRDHREYGDVDGAFAGAERVVRERFVQHRYSNQPMETRGCVAEVDRVTGTVQYHSATQNTHLLKWSLAALTGRQPVWQSLVQIVRQRDRMAELAKRAKALGEANKAAVGGQELGAGGAHRRGPVRTGLAGPDDGADLPARADPHRAPHPHAAGASRA